MSESKIFGIGLCKTGTKSLARALKQLGIPTIHYPHDERTFQELKRGECPTSIMKRYQAAADLPIACRYQQLDQSFPDSKFIFTVRHASSWLPSAQRHWQTQRKYFQNDRPEPRDHRHAFALFIAAVVFGCYEFNAARFAAVYQSHFDNVVSYFRNRPNSLLILDICNGDGWMKLCQFLQVPVPEEPFPWLGKSNAHSGPH